MERNNRKVRIGIVVSDKMEKTATVRVDNYVRHPLYGKNVMVSKNIRLMMKKTNVVLVIKLKLWKHAH